MREGAKSGPRMQKWTRSPGSSVMYPTSSPPQSVSSAMSLVSRTVSGAPLPLARHTPARHGDHTQGCLWVRGDLRRTRVINSRSIPSHKGAHKGTPQGPQRDPHRDPTGTPQGHHGPQGRATMGPTKGQGHAASRQRRHCSPRSTRRYVIRAAHGPSCPRSPPLQPRRSRVQAVGRAHRPSYTYPTPQPRNPFLLNQHVLRGPVVTRSDPVCRPVCLIPPAAPAASADTGPRQQCSSSAPARPPNLETGCTWCSRFLSRRYVFPFQASPRNTLLRNSRAVTRSRDCSTLDSRSSVQHGNDNAQHCSSDIPNEIYSLQHRRTNCSYPEMNEINGTARNTVNVSSAIG